MTFELADRIICTQLPAFVMGIVNATPDSFWKDSRGGFERAMSLIAQQADILDIGGESSRPGSEYVSEQEEIERVVPLIEKIRKESSIPISVDTRKKSVIKAAVEAGANILNDISALEDDAEIASYCASVDIPVILMHKRGLPSNMQNNTFYNDVFNEVDSYLQKQADYAIYCGIKSKRIIVDPGIGFGKDFEANLALIKNCGKLCNGRFPVLMALSRKTCIGQMTQKQEVGERLFGTLAANLISVQNGASFVRVHDVAETIDTLKVLGYNITSCNA